MTFAEQLTDAMKSLLSATYEAGKAAARPGPNLLNYVSTSWSGNFASMFYRVQFPDGYEIELDIPNAPQKLDQMFRLAAGFRKLSFIVPTDTAYSACYFVSGSSSGTSALEELALPCGIKFSNFEKFALYDKKLKSITFLGGSDGKVGIDLSESTSNDSCFMDCPELEEIRFEPNTITLSLYFKQSTKLSDESIASIVNGLATVTETQDLSLHATVINNLTPEQMTAIANKNWQVI